MIGRGHLNAPIFQRNANLNFASGQLVYFCIKLNKSKFIQFKFKAYQVWKILHDNIALGKGYPGLSWLGGEWQQAWFYFHIFQ